MTNRRRNAELKNYQPTSAPLRRPAAVEIYSPN